MKGRKKKQTEASKWKDEIFPRLSWSLFDPFYFSAHCTSAQSLFILLTPPLLWKIPLFLNCPTLWPPARSLLNGATECFHLLLIDLVLTLKFLHPSSFYGQTGRISSIPAALPWGWQLSTEHQVWMLSTWLALTQYIQQAPHFTSKELWTPLLRQVISLSPSSCPCTAFKLFPKISSTYHNWKLGYAIKKCGFLSRKFNSITKHAYAVMGWICM